MSIFAELLSLIAYPMWLAGLIFGATGFFRGARIGNSRLKWTGLAMIVGAILFFLLWLAAGFAGLAGGNRVLTSFVVAGSLAVIYLSAKMIGRVLSCWDHNQDSRNNIAQGSTDRGLNNVEIVGIIWLLLFVIGEVRNDRIAAITMSNTTGIVIDKASGQPVQDAMVVMRLPALRYYDGPSCVYSSAAMSDSSGRFQFGARSWDRLRIGDTRLEVSVYKSGYKLFDKPQPVEPESRRFLGILYTTQAHISPAEIRLEISSFPDSPSGRLEFLGTLASDFVCRNNNRQQSAAFLEAMKDEIESSPEMLGAARSGRASAGAGSPYQRIIELLGQVTERP